MALDRSGTMKLLGKSKTLVETSTRQMFFLPASIFLAESVEQVADSDILIGAQGCSVHRSGAYTGEVSAQMISEVGAHLVMVGHYEQVLKGETLSDAIEQSLRAHEVGLKVLLCLGEPTPAADPRLLEELLSALDLVVDAFQSPAWALAYEPHWAIGERGSTPSQTYLRSRIDSLRTALDERGWVSVPIVYGGSVNLANAKEIDAITACDGLFVGRAAWAPEGLERLANLVDGGS